MVQKHRATRLHYDFRLEMDGVLKSWAVPKGPSLDPADKRLAMQVEDHPVSYFDFEGTIPEGNYGAGTVMVWDMGTWEPQGDAAEMMRKGDLKFRLNGQKLKGDFALVHMKVRRPGSKGTEWLLIKHRDAYVQPGYDIDKYDYSVLTKRSLDQIARRCRLGRMDKQPKAPRTAAPARMTGWPTRLRRPMPSKAKSAAPKKRQEAAATGGTAATVAAKTPRNIRRAQLPRKSPVRAAVKKTSPNEEPNLDSNATRLGRKAADAQRHPSHAGHDHRQAFR